MVSSVKEKKIPSTLTNNTGYVSPTPGIKEMSARCRGISMATAAHYVFSSLNLDIMRKQFSQAVKPLSTLSKHPH